AACETLAADLEEAAARVRALRDALWDRLASGVPGLALHRHRELRLPDTLNVRFRGGSGNAVLAGAPPAPARQGSACPPWDAAAVLRATGVARVEAVGAVGLTHGRSPTATDVGCAAEVLVRSWRQLARA